MLKPILFNGEMVKAILDGRKIVTRRIANINTEITCNDETTNHDFELDNFGDASQKPTGFVCRKCGFGVAFPHSRVPCGTSLFRPRYWPGDILYVRETWCHGKVAYGEEPDGRCVPFISQCPGEDDFIPKEWAIREGIGIEDVVWRPSIHMPKEAARIFLRVKSVRVEQLQEGFSGDTAIFALRAEGIDIGEHCRTCIDNYGRPCCNDEDTDGGSECGMLDDVLTKFVQLWDSTIPKHPNKFKSYPYYWKDNPWVWVIEFERISKEEAGCV